MAEGEGRLFAVIRIRGKVGINPKIEAALQALNLHRANHGAVLERNPSLEGSLQKVKDYVTWGEIPKDALSLLLRKRGRLGGGARLTDAFAKERLNCESVEDLADKVWTGGVRLSEISGLDRVFRLHPPRGGFRRSKKRPYPDGELGYRSSSIGDLVRRMA